MQRWKHAGRGPKCTLIVGILLGVSSLVLYNSAYAAALASPPYPGSIALPGIASGPKLGCTPTGTTKQTWVCGFDALTSTTFTVNGRAAGGYQADSNGCVLITLSFSLGEVSVNNNAPVPTHVGTNYLVIKGHKTTSSGTYVVGLRVSFLVPQGTAQQCVTSPATTSTTSGFPTTSFSGATTTSIKRPKRPFPLFTTSTRFMPTTLAKVIETPLEISPNKVILETSLMAAVLAAILSAGALGSIWNAEAGGAAEGGGGPAPPAAGGEGGGPAPSGEGGAGPGGGAPEAPAAPEAPGPTGSGEPFIPPVTNAFTRTNLRRPLAGGGGS